MTTFEIPPKGSSAKVRELFAAGTIWCDNLGAVKGKASDGGTVIIGTLPYIEQINAYIEKCPSPKDW